MNARPALWQSLNPVLRQIRLFVLAPSQDENAIPRGRLITVSLDQQLHYDAISYAWGPACHAEPIYINDVEILVTATVLRILRRLRHQQEEKCFYIDSLCIDQNNLKERADQVLKMQYVKPPRL
jgi:hypothetical protein